MKSKLVKTSTSLLCQSGRRSRNCECVTSEENTPNCLRLDQTRLASSQHHVVIIIPSTSSSLYCSLGPQKCFNVFCLSNRQCSLSPLNKQQPQDTRQHKTESMT
eukprot:scaffold850_cov189-Ochromonas_danica.AAC.8